VRDFQFPAPLCHTSVEHRRTAPVMAYFFLLRFSAWSLRKCETDRVSTTSGARTDTHRKGKDKEMKLYSSCFVSVIARARVCEKKRTTKERTWCVYTFYFSEALSRHSLAPRRLSPVFDRPRSFDCRGEGSYDLNFWIFFVLSLVWQ
jgi:hypothetical protein